MIKQNEPKNWLDLAETTEHGHPDLKARITETHLVVFSWTEAPLEIPLEEIRAVYDSLTPDGGLRISVYVRGETAPAAWVLLRDQEKGRGFAAAMRVRSGPRNEFGFKGDLRPYLGVIEDEAGRVIWSGVRFYVSPEVAGVNLADMAKREWPDVPRHRITARQLTVEEWRRYEGGGEL